MLKTLSVIIDIHAEPDNHYLSISERDGWHGFEKGAELILSLKKSWPELKLTWLIRADPQIGEVYGDNAWGLLQYKPAIDKLLISGDEIGIHMHPYRFDDHGNQVQDYSDLEYLKLCMDQSVAAFEKAMGFKPEILANTVGTTNTTLVNHNRALGFKYDLSLNKDSKTEFAEHLGKYKGQRSSGIDFPGKVYCPSIQDYRKENATPDKYRMIPVQCFKIPAHASFKNRIGRALKGLPKHKIVKLTLAERPKFFRRVIYDTIRQGLPYLVIDSRSDIFNHDIKTKWIHNNIAFIRGNENIHLTTPDSWLC